MRSQWRRRVLVLGSLWVVSLGGGSVQAGGLFHRNGYAAPTAYVEAYPSSYVVPTTYVLRPPAYVTTSYVLSPTYSYVVPTVYSTLVPTGFETVIGYGPTEFGCTTGCGETEPCSAPPACCSQSAYETPSHTKPYTEKPPAAPAESTPATPPTPSTVESVPAQEATPPAPATAREPTTRRDTSPAPGRPSPGAADDPNFSRPPAAPATEKEGGPAAGSSVTPATPPAPITPEPAEAPTKPEAKVPAPVAPGGDVIPLDLTPAAEAETVRHQAQKPVGPAPYVRSVRDGNLHKLEGKVISTDTGRAEEGVRVALSDRQNNYVERVVVTDALGHYAVSLPDGAWTVKVTMPSGRSYPVSRLVVKGGQINDDQGRDIPSLTIRR